MCGRVGEVITIILAEGAGVMRHHNNRRNILAGLLILASRLSLKHKRSPAVTHLNRRSQRLARRRRPQMRTLPSSPSSLPSQLRPRSNILRPLRQPTPPPQASPLSKPPLKPPLEWHQE